MTYNIIYEQLEEVVAAMADPPQYLYGHRLEIVNLIKQQQSDPTLQLTRFPLIALKLDTPAGTVNGNMINYNLNIAIITSTEKGYTAKERLENVFKPVLYPLYDEFFKQLKRCGHFTWPAIGLFRPPHTKIDRFFYGTLSEEKNVKNLFDDPIDAVELIDLKINSKIKTC